MDEILHTTEGEQYEGDSIDELRGTIDEILDTGSGDPSPELVDRFNTAVAHVAEEHGLDGADVAHLVDTIRLEER